MKYSASDASAYRELGIERTTYAPGLLATTELLRDLSGKTALDFGTGTGRTAHFLKRLGAAYVIGVDQDQNMLAEAQPGDGIDYHKVGDILPFDDDSIDAALCASVFVEMGSTESIIAASRELYRVLKPGSPLAVVTTSPYSMGANFLSWQYEADEDVKDGDRITCHVKGEKPFDIEDYYWSEQGYSEALRTAGFTIEQTLLPTAEGEGWLDETRVAPDIVFFCRK